jgi:hypothetical protein
VPKPEAGFPLKEIAPLGLVRELSEAGAVTTVRHCGQKNWRPACSGFVDSLI